MLVPIYLGLCRATDPDSGHDAASVLINANLGMAALVSFVHSIAMIAAGGLVACLVYRYLGLRFVSRSWFNLDAIWAFSLISVGALSFPSPWQASTEKSFVHAVRSAREGGEVIIPPWAISAPAPRLV
jgi:hypothetical protein